MRISTDLRNFIIFYEENVNEVLLLKLSEYIQLDGTDIAYFIAKKEMTKEEIIELSFQQLEKVNNDLNAVTATRKERVFEEIKTARGLFNGVPLFLKDLSQAIEGDRSTGGAKLLANSVADSTSNFAKKIQQTGCSILGYSTTPEFGLKNITESKLHGPTRNPWNSEYSPGGSSGGAAALVASGVVPIAGASDGGGSIRIPASFCSLVGLKPTRGRTPVGPGHGRQWHGAAIHFVLTKSVRDCAAMLSKLQVVQQEAAFQTPLFPGRYEEEMKRDFSKRLKIGFNCRSPVGTPVSEEAKRAVEKVVNWLEDQGHFVEEVDPGIEGIQLMRDYYLMNSGEMAALILQLERELGRKITANDVEIETWLLHQAGQHVSAAEFTISIASWDHAAEKMARLHENYDFYITPATAYPAPKVGELTHRKEKEVELREEIEKLNPKDQQQLIYDMFLPSLTYTPFTQLANLTGQPAISLPVHLTEEGLPLGVQVIAPKGHEHRLLQLAYQLEQSELWVGMKGNPYFAEE